MDKEEFMKKTRKVYLSQHKNYVKDKIIMNRFIKMTNDPKYYHLSKKDFKGKNILDAGCGNSAYFQISMHQLGVKKHTCLDIGKQWIPELKKGITKHNIPLSEFEFVSASTDKLPFADETFDMVFSNGVLMHLKDMKQTGKAFKELTRVTKKGGFLYVVLGINDGLFEKYLVPAIRQYYRDNKEVKNVIDNITPKDFQKLFYEMANGMKKYTGETFNYKQFSKLFDLDLCTTLQNVIQVPVRNMVQLDFKWGKKQYEKNGFKDVKRCSRFVYRKNIRKFFASMHYEHKNKYSKLLYGNGNIELIAKKSY
jgi:ubiquinone/menaquinone biosynthesis C-methylase UbiE